MEYRRLPNYLRMHRKRLGLTQEDVAYLLGVESGAKVSRYEKFNRAPNLETILAYQAICGHPVSDLVAGTFESVEKEVVKRAKELDKSFAGRKPTPQIARKRQALADIIIKHTKSQKTK